jgi:hypothetical protein
MKIKFLKEMGATKNKKSKFLKSLAMLYLVLSKRVIIS